jgi:hypothetical protein
MRLARAVDQLAATVGARSTSLRWALAGAVAAAILGGIAGLLIGLLAYPPTAWFAVFELGAPAGALGAFLGGLLGLLAQIARTVFARWFSA